MKLDHLQRQHNHAEATLAKLTTAVLADMIRRVDQPVANDGYPRQTLNLNGSGGTSTDTTVEANALRGLPDDNTPDDWGLHEHVNDRMAEAIAELGDMLAMIDKAAAVIDRNLDMIQHAHDKVSGPDAPPPSPDGYCQACKRWVSGTHLDRLRSSYCAACYRQWIREGRPDRLTYEATRTDQGAAVAWIDKATRQPVTIVTGGFKDGKAWGTW